MFKNTDVTLLYPVACEGWKNLTYNYTLFVIPNITSAISFLLAFNKDTVYTACHKCVMYY